MRDTGWGAMVCGIHTRKSRCAVPRRNKCGGERIEYHYRGKEEGRPWLVGPAALSAGTLEERLVLSPAIATFAITAATLAASTEAIGATHAALRQAHLKYHLLTVEVLTPTQIERYAELRGYKGGAQHPRRQH
jgi:hypothetical protein